MLIPPGVAAEAIRAGIYRSALLDYIRITEYRRADESWNHAECNRLREIRQMAALEAAAENKSRAEADLIRRLP